MPGAWEALTNSVVLGRGSAGPEKSFEMSLSEN